MYLLKFITLCTLLGFSTTLAAQIKEWEDPAVFNIGRLAPHAHFIPFETQKMARDNNKSQSAYFQSLNGIWKFNIAPNPANRPVDFYKESFDISGWSDIPVPANWERQGFDTAIYVNQTYPFWQIEGKKPNPPQIPHAYNPVGSYKRTFTIPENWNQRNIIIHLGAVKSILHLGEWRKSGL